MNVWSLDIDTNISGHIGFALNKKNVWNTLVVICVSMAEPWDMENSIDEALKLVQGHVQHLDLEPEEMAQLQSTSRFDINCVTNLDADHTLQIKFPNQTLNRFT